MDGKGESVGRERALEGRVGGEESGWGREWVGGGGGCEQKGIGAEGEG